MDLHEKKHKPASLRPGSVITNVIVIIVKSSLNDLRGLLHEIQELRRGKNANLFLLRQICPFVQWRDKTERKVQTDPEFPLQSRGPMSRSLLRAFPVLAPDLLWSHVREQ
jgi:hypothetical protein